MRMASGAAGLFFKHQAAAASICVAARGFPQRRALCSGDTPETFKEFIRGDRLSSVGLGDRFQELRLKFRRDLKGFFRFASNDRHDGTLGQGISLHDDLSAYDDSGS